MDSRRITCEGESARSGEAIDRVRCCRQIVGTVRVVDAEIVFRMLVIILRAHSIVDSLRFARQVEVALDDLRGAAADTFGGAAAVEHPIVLRRSPLLGGPLCVEAAARVLIWP